MNKTTLILLVKFKSPLSLEEIEEVVDSRIDEFRALKGLQQKYYLQEPATQEYAGLYLWESGEDFEAFRDSELRASIAKAYQTTLLEQRPEDSSSEELVRELAFHVKIQRGLADSDAGRTI